MFSVYIPCAAELAQLIDEKFSHHARVLKRLESLADAIDKVHLKLPSPHCRSWTDVHYHLSGDFVCCDGLCCGSGFLVKRDINFEGRILREYPSYLLASGLLVKFKV